MPVKRITGLRVTGLNLRQPGLNLEEKPVIGKEINDLRRKLMKSRFLCGVLATLFLLTGVAVYAETLPDIQAHKNCKYCGMDREKFAHSRMLTEYSDGSSFGSCSIHCTAIDLAQTFDKQPKAIMVADYNQKNLIDAEKASWVIGGKKPGVMTKTAKWAFADKKDAEAFIKENGGKLATFEDAMKATYDDMYNDTKMIREKRAKMKEMQKEHKH
jgi:nitrous oxide reductase accessory protein NosL